MAQDKRESNVGELPVKVDIDAEDAIKALKAIQREAKAAIRALRELEAESGKRERYTEAIKRLAGDSYTHLPMNDRLYEAIQSPQSVTTLWTDRCSGGTTSALAAVMAFEDVALYVEHSSYAKRLREITGTTRVRSLDDIDSVPTLNGINTVIIDEVTDRKKTARITQSGINVNIVKIRAVDMDE